MANNNETLHMAEEVAAATIETTETVAKKKLSKKAKIGIAIGAGVAAAVGFGAIVVSKCFKKKDDEEILVVESAE